MHTTRQRQTMRNRKYNGFTAFALGGALALAISAVAFTEKPSDRPKARQVSVEVDQRPISRDNVGRTSYAPVVKKVSPGVVKVFVTTKAQNTGFSGPPEMNYLF